MLNVEIRPKKFLCLPLQLVDAAGGEMGMGRAENFVFILGLSQMVWDFYHTKCSECPLPPALSTHSGRRL